MLDAVLLSGGTVGNFNDMLIITAFIILLIIILLTTPSVVKRIRNIHWKKRKVEL